jgi:hypothetical protein
MMLRSLARQWVLPAIDSRELQQVLARSKADSIFPLVGRERVRFNAHR